MKVECCGIINLYEEKFLRAWFYLSVTGMNGRTD